MLRNLNVISAQPLAVGAGQLCRAVRTERDIRGPCGHCARDFKAALAFAIHGDGLTAQLPAITVRTLKDTGAEQRFDPVDLWKMVHDTRRNQELSASDPPLACFHLEYAAGQLSDPRYLTRAEFNVGVPSQLAPSDPPKFGRLDSVSSEKAVYRL